MSKLADLYKVDLTHAAWRKSTYTAGNGNCVEISTITGPATGVAIRDSKNINLPDVRASRTQWAAFLDAVATGDLTA